jgi:Secretion system C-terminal sorting domain
MKQLIQPLFAALLMAGVATTAEAQVKFKLSRLSANQYRISMVPEQSLAARQAITSTMQVSLKIDAASGFQLADITSLNPEAEWDKGGLLRSPEGARAYDYLFVGLKSMATRAFAFEQGKEIPLFTFRNAAETPASEVVLLDNATEVLIKNPRNPYNVGNHISVLGFGIDNAWRGNLAAVNEPGTLMGLRSVFPNPASEELTVEWDNYDANAVGEVQLGLTDSGAGRTLQQQTERQQQGRNRATMNVSTLTAGSYLLHLEHNGTRLGDALKVLIVR